MNLINFSQLAALMNLHNYDVCRSCILLCSAGSSNSSGSAGSSNSSGSAGSSNSSCSAGSSTCVLLLVLVLLVVLLVLVVLLALVVPVNCFSGTVLVF